MRIFAIGDLHLEGNENKKMDVFGDNWANHKEKIQTDWLLNVQEDDLVLIPGDISWAMHFEDALIDLDFIGSLPGQKVLLRGNHDYWWPGIQRLRENLPDNTFALQNDALKFGDIVLCGTRLWNLQNTTKDDKKIFDRELIRLELSLQQAKKIGGTIVVMTHFPPLIEDMMDNEVTALLSAYNASYVFYGHLHGQAHKNAFTGVYNGIQYTCVSCDRLNFKMFLSDIVVHDI